MIKFITFTKNDKRRKRNQELANSRIGQNQVLERDRRNL